MMNSLLLLTLQPSSAENSSNLASKDINERTIGKLFGHSPSKTSITGVYGSVDLDTMRRALVQLD
jgi:hypothetical protein